MFGCDTLDLSRDIAAAVIAEEEVNEVQLESNMRRIAKIVRMSSANAAAAA